MVGESMLVYSKIPAARLCLRFTSKDLRLRVPETEPQGNSLKEDRS